MFLQKTRTHLFIIISKEVEKTRNTKNVRKTFIIIHSCWMKISSCDNKCFAKVYETVSPKIKFSSINKLIIFLNIREISKKQLLKSFSETKKNLENLATLADVSASSHTLIELIKLERNNQWPNIHFTEEKNISENDERKNERNTKALQNKQIPWPWP